MLRFLVSKFCILFLLSFVEAQIGPVKIITDERDGNQYKVIKINNLWWFQDNLNYVTQESHCPNYNKKDKDCQEGNFHPYFELAEACPDGWRVANVEDWEKYFHLLREKKKIEKEVLKYDTIPAGEIGVMISDTSEQIHLFAESNPLGLSDVGWIQGNKRRKVGTITLWADNIKGDDPYYHLHIGNNGYVKHTHKHHIVDKPKKQRKFIIKCVTEVKTQMGLKN